MTWLVCAAALTVGCEDKPAPTPDPLPSASAAAVHPATSLGPKVYEHQVLSEVYEIDKIYKSMQGPASLKQLTLGPSAERELLWIVGFEAVMVSADASEKISQEWMCHTNLDLDIDEHQARFGDQKRLTGRLFTLSQGQYRIDFPPGFGMPVVSDELLDVNTQVLNLNAQRGVRQVRHRVTLRFMRDADLAEPMKALFVAGAFGLKLLEGADGHYGRDPAPGAKAAAKKSAGAKTAGAAAKRQQDADRSADDHAGCLAGANAGNNSFDDGKGRTFTGHWVVEPGLEENHTRVTQLMDLPFDTTVHYVAAHLHPFARSLELRDLTTGKTVYTAKTRQADKGIGLAHVDFYASPQGFTLFEKHEYEIVSIYDNSSGVAQDSMAVLNLYMFDKNFTKPDLSLPDDDPKTGGGKAAPAEPRAPASSSTPPGKLM